MPVSEAPARKPRWGPEGWDRARQRAPALLGGAGMTSFADKIGKRSIVAKDSAPNDFGCPLVPHYIM